MKLCKDCEHYMPALAMWSLFTPAFCKHPENMSSPDPVEGRVHSLRPPLDLRTGVVGCGPDASWFLARITPL